MWCTGYTGDFSWLLPRSATPPDDHDTTTAPPRSRDLVHRAAVAHPPQLRQLLGFPADAAATADAVVTHLLVTVGGRR